MLTESLKWKGFILGYSIWKQNNAYFALFQMITAPIAMVTVPTARDYVMARVRTGSMVTDVT